MIKHKCYITFICAMFLFFIGTMTADGDEYIKNIEIAEAAINIDHNEFSPVAYLFITLKNNGDRNISNVAFEIKYYDKEDYLIKRVVIKNALNDTMPGGEARKYKVRLNRDVVNVRNEQYPYSHEDAVAEFDIEIINVKFALR